MFLVMNISFGGLLMFYVYVIDVNWIFGEGNDDSYLVVWCGDYWEDINLLNLNYKFEGIGVLLAYYYDIENELVVVFFFVIYGVCFVGDMKFDLFSFGYELEYVD